MHIEIPVGLEDKNGNIYPAKGVKSNGRASADLPGCSGRPYLITLAYNGFTTVYNTANSNYEISHTWTIEVPSGDYTLLSSTGVYKGYPRYVNADSGGFPLGPTQHVCFG